jgi:predicted amidophosphoribosyltransferase
MALGRSSPVDWLIPPSCPGCGTPGEAPCARCVASLEPGGLLDVPGVDAAVALVRYEGSGARIVQALKYRNHRDALGRLGRALARLVHWSPDAVTWVPTTSRRRRRRGYDQAELLAQEVADALGVPLRGLLERVDEGSQTRRSRMDRRTLVAVRPTGPAPPSVLVVDDVCTTGASLTAAARALRTAGAKAVGAVTVAATP